MCLVSDCLEIFLLTFFPPANFLLVISSLSPSETENTVRVSIFIHLSKLASHGCYQPLYLQDWGIRDKKKTQGTHYRTVLFLRS